MVQKLTVLKILPLAPRHYVNITLASSLGVILLLLWAATKQPRFGVFLVWNDSKGALLVEKESSLLGLLAGDQLDIVTDSTGRSMRLDRKFLTALPKDRRIGYPDKRSYFEDRKRLYQIVQNAPHTMTFKSGKQIRAPLVHESSTGVLAEGFWFRLGSGLFIWICGISVWMWKPSRPELVALGFSSTGLMICATGQALYADIPNIYSPEFDWVLNFLVNAGLVTGPSFALGLIFFYPVPLRYANTYWRLLKIAIPAALLVFLLEDWRFNLGLSGQPVYVDDIEVYAALLCVYGMSLLILAYQMIVYRHNAKIRKQLLWTFVVIVCGPGTYQMFRAIPLMFGLEPIMSRNDSWVVISFVYLFVVVAVARVNLFNLGRHIVAAWHWVLLGLAFLALDFVIMRLFSLTFQENVFFLFSLALTGYIFIRQALYKRLSPDTSEQDSKLFAEALGELVTYTPGTSVSAKESWEKMLLKLFNPVSIDNLHDSEETSCVRGAGQFLIVASNRYCPPQRLEYAQQGTRGFTKEDVALADEARKVFERLTEYEEAYRSGQVKERRRIRRDLHDHVGSRLLSVIHAAPDKTTRGLAEAAMKELGNSISNIKLRPYSIADLGNEIRVITEEICGSANLEFQVATGSVGDNRILAPDACHALLSIVRESLNNILRHSGATSVIVEMSTSSDTNCVNLIVTDNGCGFDQEQIVLGDGLRNIKERVSELGGKVDWSFDQGSVVAVSLTLVLESKSV